MYCRIYVPSEHSPSAAKRQQCMICSELNHSNESVSWYCRSTRFSDWIDCYLWNQQSGIASMFTNILAHIHQYTYMSIHPNIQTLNHLYTRYTYNIYPYIHLYNYTPLHQYIETDIHLYSYKYIRLHTQRHITFTHIQTFAYRHVRLIHMVMQTQVYPYTDSLIQMFTHYTCRETLFSALSVLKMWLVPLLYTSAIPR